MSRASHLIGWPFGRITAAQARDLMPTENADIFLSHIHREIIDCARCGMTRAPIPRAIDLGDRRQILLEGSTEAAVFAELEALGFRIAEVGKPDFWPGLYVFWGDE